MKIFLTFEPFVVDSLEEGYTSFTVVDLHLHPFIDYNGNIIH